MSFACVTKEKKRQRTQDDCAVSHLGGNDKNSTDIILSLYFYKDRGRSGAFITNDPNRDELPLFTIINYCVQR